MAYHIIILILFSLFLTPASTAKLLQIIHTNDLHSHFEHADMFQMGGYAKVKATIDTLKSLAEAQGIETLLLDAGDFSEGTPFFMAEEGKLSWKMMDAIGFEAVAIGNHDWLIGLRQMDEILGTIRPQTRFVSANFLPRHGYVYQTDFKNAYHYIQPYASFDKGGIKIGVLGLSTDEFLYAWRKGFSNIEPAIRTAKEQIPDIRFEHDFVIALTHLGVLTDQKLIKNTEGIDLVVGGHSHTALFEPLYEKNLRGKKTPIVQAGKHGEYVGDLLVDLVPNRPLKIIHYKLIPVMSEDPSNPEMDEQVARARASLEIKYGREWFYEPLVYSQIPLERPLNHQTYWGNLYAETLKETIGADFSLDVGEFFGGTQLAGMVTRETLFQFYPRVFDVQKPLGWTIWEIQISGELLNFILQSLNQNHNFLNTAGLSYPLDPHKIYRGAVSEGVGRGALEANRLLHLILKPKDTGIPIWMAVEKKIRQMGSVILAP